MLTYLVIINREIKRESLMNSDRSPFLNQEGTTLEIFLRWHAQKLKIHGKVYIDWPHLRIFLGSMCDLVVINNCF